MYNRETFFSAYRVAFGSLSQKQVEGLEFLLGKLEQDTFSLKQAAYILATIHHETGVTRNGESQRFHPIKELRERATSPRRKNQDRYWLTGYYGRGYVQITWEKNYAKFGIADEPDKALEPETAYEIATRGMREGMFTGRKLSDFINGKADYRNARTIINGHDKADEIAAYARKYEAALIAARSSAPVPKTADADSVEAKPATDDGVQASSPPSGAVSEPDAKEVKMSAMSSTSKGLTFSMIGSALLLALKEAWTSAREETLDAGKFAVNHLPQTLLILGLAALGVLIYNAAMKRRDQRTNKIIDITADKSKNDVVVI